MDEIIEVLNDVAERKYRLNFGRRGSVLVDPDQWDGYAEAKLADIGKREQEAAEHGSEAVRRVLAELLLPYLAEDNPDLTVDGLLRLRQGERLKILGFFVNPARALEQSPPLSPPQQADSPDPATAVAA